MTKQSLESSFLIVVLFTSALGQKPSPAASTEENAPRKAKQESRTVQAEKDDVVRISVNLVQVDVTVVDDNGRQVRDLKPEDFEVLEDNRPQTITNFSYTSSSNAPKTENRDAPVVKPIPGLSVRKSGKTLTVATPTPPVRLRPEQVRRTVALVVDDLGLSHESSSLVRQALRKFVDQQIQQGDLVAIVRTGAGMGALQQFTTDKQQLHTAIDSIRYNLTSRSSISAFAPIGVETLIRHAHDQRNTELDVQKDAEYTGIKQPGRELDEFRSEIFSVGTLGALNFVIRGFSELPGRKSIVLFSDGFKLYTQDPGNRRVLDNLRRLTDLANRASVVIYTIDPRGLQTLGLTAADNLSGPITGATGDPLTGGDLTHREYLKDIEDRIADRRTEFFETQQGLSYLAEQTGGFVVKNNNDISGAVQRVMNDQSGFYLIGYRPDDQTFKVSNRNFRNLTIKVKRPNLKVRTRKGFYSFTEEEARRPLRRTSSEQLFAALTSPFASGDMRLRITGAFGYDVERKAHFMQSLLHIDACDLVFTQQAGTRQAVIELMAVTFGDNGKVVDTDDRAYTIRLAEKDFQRAQSAGLVYMVTLPIKKPGAYQLRIAVRDTANGRTGSANQFINVPDVRKNGLALSGLTLRGRREASAIKTSVDAALNSPQPLASQPQAERVDEMEPLAGSASRKLRRGMVLEYGYFIYNARIDKSTSRPKLLTHVRLFRERRLVYEGKLKEFDPATPTNPKQLIAGGSLQLGKDLQPGEYILQVVVYDLNAKDDRALASQWIDFDILE